MDERRRRDGGEDEFSWSSEPEPDWVEGIRDARRRRASRLAEALSGPDDPAPDLPDAAPERRTGDADKEERR